MARKFCSRTYFRHFACFLYEILVSQPEIMPILSNLLPKKEIIFNPSMLYIAIEF